MIRAIRGEPLGIVYLGLVGFCFAGTTYLIPAQFPMALAAIALVGAIVFQGKRFRIGGRSGAALLLYGACVVISVPFSIWLGQSIQEMQQTLKLFVIFLVAVNVLTSRRRILWLIGTLVVLVALYPALGGVRFYLSGHLDAPGRANWRGVYGNANALALAMTVYLPFAVMFLGMRRTMRWRLIWGAVVTLFVAVVILTKSRAGFLALGLEGLLALSVSRRKAAMASALVVGGVAVAVLSSGAFKERMDTMFNTGAQRDYSAESRLIIWRTAIGIALSHPLTGAGVGTYAMANAENAPKSLGTSGGNRWKDTHENYLNIWAEIGTPGLIAFLAFLVLLLRDGWRASRRLRRDDEAYLMLRAGMVSMMAFMVMGLFNTFIDVWFIYVIAASMLSLVHLARRRSSPAAASPRASRRFGAAAAPKPLGAAGLPPGPQVG